MSFQINIKIKNFGTSSFESAKLLYDDFSFSRFRFNQSFVDKHYKNSFLDYNYVNNNKSFYYRASGKIERIGVKYSPNISFVNEKNNLLNRYQKSGLGINYNEGNSNIESGFNFRIDEDFLEGAYWSINSKDLILYTNINSQSNLGWKRNIIYKKRIKKNNESENLNYSFLAKLFSNLSSSQREKIFQMLKNTGTLEKTGT